MTEITVSYHPVGNGHELAMQTLGDPAGLKILMVHGGPGYYWIPDNLVLLHDRLTAAGHKACLQALSCRGCGIGTAVSRYTDILDDDLLKRAGDLGHFSAPDILLGHSTGAMVVLAALAEGFCTPRTTALISPYTASLGEHDYWVTEKAKKYPLQFNRFYDFVAEQWRTYKGTLPADLREKLYPYWGELFFALPDRDLQIKAHLLYGNFHVMDALPHVGFTDGQPFIIHHTLLDKWPDFNDAIKDNLWRTGMISANWWRSNYQNGYPLMDRVKAHKFTQPVHILSGLNDEITPPHTVQKLADILQIDPVFVADCGHLAEANVQGHLDIALAKFLGDLCQSL